MTTNNVSDNATNSVSCFFVLLLGFVLEVNMRGIGLTREKVIEKAGELANEEGLNAVTITNLANYLGIKKPSLYNHIKDQDDIYSEIMKYGWEYISNEICPNILSEDAKEAITELSNEIYKYAVENPGVFEAMLWYNSYKNEKINIAMEGVYHFFFSQTDKLGIEREVANHLLRTYRSMVEGFLLLVIHDSFGNPASMEESFRISIELFTRGLDLYRTRTI